MEGPQTHSAFVNSPGLLTWCGGWGLLLCLGLRSRRGEGSDLSRVVWYTYDGCFRGAAVLQFSTPSPLCWVDAERT